MAKTLAPLAVILLAFALRVAALDSVPPGWRDDEVIETTVHAQLVLDGHYPLYFIQAEGHEPLYHYLSAGWIALAGRSLFSVRLVSAAFGALAVAAAFRLTRQLFGARTALIVALLLAVSFWALMYSRVKIRHMAELPFVLLAFSHLFKALSRRPSVIGRRSSVAGHRLSVVGHQLSVVGRHSSFVIRHLSLVILFAALALYTYLAAITVFIVLGLFGLYLLALRRAQPGTPNPKPVFIVLALAFLLYLPLAIHIRANAERLAVVGGPLTAARAGDWQPLLGNIAGTLAMFGGSGDPEALYNLPGRPVFNLIGFYFFAAGVVIAISRWRDPRYGFLLIWLLGGLAPGFASNPPASLGHTITALPVVYILAVLPIAAMPTTDDRRLTTAGRRLSSIVLLGSVAFGDLSDYFLRWPADPEVRYLYKADLHTAAESLRGGPPDTYVLSGPLSKWDRVAFTLEGLQFESAPRWVNGEWAAVIPAQSAIYLYDLPEWFFDSRPLNPASVRFENDLELMGWLQRGAELYTHWQAGPGYAAAEPDMGSSVASPPFPVFIFVHLLDANGNYVAGSDRFDADAFSLQPGDRFIQRHTFDAPPGVYRMVIGLYDPVGGARTLTGDGRDAVEAGAVQLP